MVIVRLKRYVSRPAASTLARLFESDDLGMRNAILAVETFSNNFAVGISGDAANERIGTHESDAVRSEVKRALHQSHVPVGRDRRSLSCPSRTIQNLNPNRRSQGGS